jgi:hypothetical protein
MAVTQPQTRRREEACEVDIGFGDLAIDRAGIVAVLGYRAGAIPEHFDTMIDRALAEAAKRCQPRAGYRIVESGRMAKRHEAIAAGGIVFTTQRIVAGALAQAEHVAVFAATIGPAFEEWARATMADDPALGFIADAVGSAVAEALADRLHDRIERDVAERGWKVTNRYSPGYCGWSVAEQHQLFTLLPAGFCGITLSESALMSPVKSVSGLIGVGAEAKHADYLCDVCKSPDCTYRRYHERRAKLGMEAARRGTARPANTAL